MLLARKKHSYYNNIKHDHIFYGTFCFHSCKTGEERYHERKVTAMLKNSSFLDTLLWNLIIVAIWHLVFLFACQKLPDSTFDASKNRYIPREWEHGGRWYRDYLKIQLWKDRLPQHIGKEGFSKKHLNSDSIEYIDQFILETCRGEWNHKKNCLCSIVMLLINPLLVGVIVSTLILIGNLPFAMVQRYNRFRLLVLRKRRIRDIRSAELGQSAVTA